jgi:hypothetical protein
MLEQYSISLKHGGWRRQRCLPRIQFHGPSQKSKNYPSPRPVPHLTSFLSLAPDKPQAHTLPNPSQVIAPGPHLILSSSSSTSRHPCDLPTPAGLRIRPSAPASPDLEDPSHHHAANHMVKHHPRGSTICFNITHLFQPHGSRSTMGYTYAILVRII